MAVYGDGLGMERREEEEALELGRDDGVCKFRLLCWVGLGSNKL